MLRSREIDESHALGEVGGVASVGQWGGEPRSLTRLSGWYSHLSFIRFNSVNEGPLLAS